MNLARAENRIRELLTLFVVEVELAVKQNNLHVPVVAERVLIPLLQEVYGLPHLKNLNKDKGKNFPAIDLGDEIASVGIQVTAQSNNQKTKETLETFIRHELYKDYSTLYIYELTGRKKRRNAKGFAEIVDGKFTFSPENNIWNFETLIETISNIDDIHQVLRIERLLEAHFGSPSQSTENRKPTNYETVTLNLLEVSFPEYLYIAPISVNREDVIRASRLEKKRLGHKSSGRDVIRAALRQKDLSAGIGWQNHAGMLVTFRNLDDESQVLREVIDEGSIEKMRPSDYYGIDIDYENVFKALLGRCLQEQLYRRGVAWQYEDKLYIFTEREGSLIWSKDKLVARQYEVWGKSSTRREVFKRQMNNKNPLKVLKCQHFGFKTRFLNLDDSWYVAIRPEWFISFDGYRKSAFGADNIKYKKKMENDMSVTNHVKFISYFLKHSAKPSLFNSAHNAETLGFGELVTFDKSPALIDAEYLPSKQSRNKSGSESQLELDL